jgi:SAM-dependent methyltransferase
MTHPHGSPAPHPHELSPPSDWVKRWAAAIVPGGRVLDLACGSGRHTRWLAGQGFEVLAVDRDTTGLPANIRGIESWQVDLESLVWPLLGREFDAVVVTNYLFRPRFAELLTCVRPGGILIYETFMVGHERFGRPSNPDFLLLHGELKERVEPDFEVLDFVEGEVIQPKPAVTQRLCARRRPVSGPV